MTARDSYMAGLKAGWIDESLGIVEPVPPYPDDDPYLEGVRRGRAAWRREESAVMVVDRPSLASLTASDV